MKICKERCNQCLFSENRIVPKKRMGQIIRECRKRDSHFICHKHSQVGEDVMCRGFFETQPSTNLLRIAMRLNVVKFVHTPAEQPPC